MLGPSSIAAEDAELLKLAIEVEKEGFYVVNIVGVDNCELTIEVLEEDMEAGSDPT